MIVLTVIHIGHVDKLLKKENFYKPLDALKAILKIYCKYKINFTDFSSPEKDVIIIHATDINNDFIQMVFKGRPEKLIELFRFIYFLEGINIWERNSNFMYPSTVEKMEYCFNQAGTPKELLIKKYLDLLLINENRLKIASLVALGTNDLNLLIKSLDNDISLESVLMQFG